MPREALLEWEGKEYDHVPKSADWYWALGIIAIAGAVAAVLFGSFLIALLILSAASAIALHAAKEPGLHHFRIVEQGLLIDDELHPFDRMTSFSILEHMEGALPPMISIKTESWLSPHLVIPLAGVDAEAVYLHFVQHVTEDEHHHTLADLVATWLGF